MLNIIPKHKFYLRIFQNELELIDLKNGKAIRRSSSVPFSRNGLLIAEFTIAEKIFRSLVHEILGKKKFIFPIDIVAQPTEIYDGKISEVEKMTITELCSYVGGKAIIVEQTERKLSNSEAINLIN